MKNKFFGILFALCYVVFCSSVTYADTIPKIEYNISENRVTISGTTNSEHIVLRLLKYGKTIEELLEMPYDDGIVLYRNQLDAKHMENGKFVFNIRYASLDDESFNSGVYNAYLTTDKNTNPIPIELNLFTKKNYETAVTVINEYAKAEDAENFKNTLENYADVFGYNQELYSVISSSDELESCMEYVKKYPLGTEKSNENAKIINKFLAMQALKETKVTNIDNYIDAIFSTTSEIYKNYAEYTDDENNNPVAEKQTYLTTKMVKELPERYTYEDFEYILKKAIVLTGVRFADGYGEVKSVLELYGHSVGITDTASSKVYKAMSGQEYEDSDDIKNKYKELKENQNSSSSGGGGGGNSSKNDGYYKDAVLEVEPENKTEIKDESVKIYFEDIDGVEWASAEILALADKGIINGVGDGKFKPNANVTREEFAKILVGAMGLETLDYGVNNFSDVSKGDWFCPYVNIAYKNNIVKGIGNGKFGAGESITRQDMIVMICNAIKAKGVHLPKGNIPFEDASMISDYAISSVEALYEMGVVNGVSETHFAPAGIASRAQAAKIVYGVLDILK